LGELILAAFLQIHIPLVKVIAELEKKIIKLFKRNVQAHFANSGTFWEKAGFPYDLRQSKLI
jgi:hypothetical protein